MGAEPGREQAETDLWLARNQAAHKARMDEWRRRATARDGVE